MGIEIIASIMAAGIGYFSNVIVDFIKSSYKKSKERSEIIISIKKRHLELQAQTLELEALIKQLEALQAKNQVIIKNIDKEKMEIKISEIKTTANNGYK